MRTTAKLGIAFWDTRAMARRPIRTMRGAYQDDRRADRPRRRLEGAGIGLALVRRIAELHGAAVRVEDRPSGGARFVLQFPRITQPA